MITVIGKQKLQEKISELKEELRLTYQKRAEAAAEGDLKENSAYIYAGEKANLLNTQIETAATELKLSVVQSAPSQVDTITFGHQITVHFETDQRTVTFTLVGKNDARLKPDWISIESPLGIAVNNKHKSDKVVVNDQPVTIIDIQIGKI